MSSILNTHWQNRSSINDRLWLWFIHLLSFKLVTRGKHWLSYTSSKYNRETIIACQQCGVDDDDDGDGVGDGDGHGGGCVYLKMTDVVDREQSLRNTEGFLIEIRLRWKIISDPCFSITSADSGVERFWSWSPAKHRVHSSRNLSSLHSFSLQMIRSQNLFI